MPSSSRTSSRLSILSHYSNKARTNINANQRISNALDHTIRFIQTAQWLNKGEDPKEKDLEQDELNASHLRHKKKKFDIVRSRATSQEGFFRRDRERIDGLTLEQEYKRTLLSSGYGKPVFRRTDSINRDEEKAESIGFSQIAESNSSKGEIGEIGERVERYRILGEQYDSLDSECMPPSLNRNKLIERENCGLVFRKDSRPPSVISKDGFGPSHSFWEIHPLLTLPDDQMPLVVSRTLQGARDFKVGTICKNEYVYAIYCDGIPGVRGVENARFNYKNFTELFCRVTIEKREIAEKESARLTELLLDEMHITPPIPPERIFLVETDDPEYQQWITHEEREIRRLEEQRHESLNSISTKLNMLGKLLWEHYRPLFSNYLKISEWFVTNPGNAIGSISQAIIRDLEHIKRCIIQEHAFTNLSPKIMERKKLDRRRSI